MFSPRSFRIYVLWAVQQAVDKRFLGPHLSWNMSSENFFGHDNILPMQSKTVCHLIAFRCRVVRVCMCNHNYDWVSAYEYAYFLILICCIVHKINGFTIRAIHMFGQPPGDVNSSWNCSLSQVTIPIIYLTWSIICRLTTECHLDISLP